MFSMIDTCLKLTWKRKLSFAWKNVTTICEIIYRQNAITVTALI